MNELGYAIGRHTIETIGQGPSGKSTFSLLDLEWEHHPGVFGGEERMPATAYFTSLLPYEGVGSFLEMGCGSGVTAVVAALRGCPAVTALDINPAAVENARANAERHGVGDRVRALTSDLFGALDQGESFDLVYWNSPFIEAPADRPQDSYFEYAIFDPGYRMHREFMREAPARLNDGGRLFLGFSTAAGNLDLIYELGREAGLKGGVHDRQEFGVPPSALGTAPEFAAHADAEGLVHVDFTLLEFQRA
jgi:SAM-dependent methyltransferase